MGVGSLVQGKEAQPEFYGYVNIFRHAERNRDLYRAMLGGQGSSVLTARVQAHLVAEYEHDIGLLPQKIFTELSVPKDVLIQLITGAVMHHKKPPGLT